MLDNIELIAHTYHQPQERIISVAIDGTSYYDFDTKLFRLSNIKLAKKYMQDCINNVLVSATGKPYKTSISRTSTKITKDIIYIKRNLLYLGVELELIKLN